MIQNTYNGMGVSGRDQLLEDQFGWVDQVWLQELYVMLRYPLARRVVTDAADQITEAGIHVSASGVSSDKVDDLSKYIEEHTKAGSLHDALVGAMAFGMGAEILVVDDGRPLNEPVDEANIRDVVAVIPSHRWELTPYHWGSSPVVRGPKGWTVNQYYQEPIVYSYTPWLYGSDITGRGGDWLEGEHGEPWSMPSWERVKAGTMIHASRICHYPGMPLPNLLQRDNGGYADSLMRQCRRPILAWYSHVHHAGDAGRHLSELVYTGDRLTQAIDMPMSGVQTAEQAQAYLANIIASQQLLSSYRGIRLLTEGEKLEYLARPLTGFDQLTQVIMVDNALSAGIPLEHLFMVSPPGGLGASGAGRFIWDNYAASHRRRFDGYIRPPRSKLYRYAALAKNGPIASDVLMALELGPLTTETLLERAQRKLAEYQALSEAQQSGWFDPREVRAREKQTRDDFITLEDKYDADLQRPGGLDLAGLMENPPAGGQSGTEVDERSVGFDPADADSLADFESYLSSPDDSRTDEGDQIAGVDADRFIPPDAVQKAAKAALERRKSGQKGGLSTGEAGAQGIGSGVARAAQLSSGKRVSPEIVRRINTFFGRFKRFADAPLDSKGKQAYQLWGGSSAATWAASLVEAMDKAKSRADGADALPSSWQGVPLVLSYRAGEERYGRRLPARYGYILGTVGADGEGVDVFCGSDLETTTAYVVRQMKPGGEAFDEFKVMVGYPSSRAAVVDYLQYAPSLESYGGFTAVEASDLLAWLESHREG